MKGIVPLSERLSERWKRKMPMTTKALAAKLTIGFGCPNKRDPHHFVNEIGPHHFVVDIPADRYRPVLITENYGIESTSGEGLVDRCELPRSTWTALAEEVRAEFNQRLKEKHLAPGRWRIGENKVERLLGKELLVLAWAVEQASCAVVPQALRNWQGLKPEERWWLCTMTAAATGRLNDSGRGWRKALYHILVENPVE